MTVTVISIVKTYPIKKNVTSKLYQVAHDKIYKGNFDQSVKKVDPNKCHTLSVSSYKQKTTMSRRLVLIAVLISNSQFITSLEEWLYKTLHDARISKLI